MVFGQPNTKGCRTHHLTNPLSHHKPNQCHSLPSLSSDIYSNIHLTSPLQNAKHTQTHPLNNPFSFSPVPFLLPSPPPLKPAKLLKALPSPSPPLLLSSLSSLPNCQTPKLPNCQKHNPPYSILPIVKLISLFGAFLRRFLFRLRLNECLG